MNEDPDGPPERAPTPAPLLVAASVTFVQGLLVAAGAVAEGLAIDTDRFALGLSTTVFFGLCAAGLLWCARGLQQVRAWARGPVLLAQLVGLGLAWNLRGSWEIAVPLVVGSAITLAGLLHPRSIQVIEQARD